MCHFCAIGITKQKQKLLKERFVIALQRLVKVILAWTQFKYVGRLRDLEAGKNCGWMAVGF